MKSLLTKLLLLLTSYAVAQSYATIPFTDNFTAGGTSLNSPWTTSFTNAAGRIEQRNEVGNWPKFTLNNGITAPSGKGMVIYNSTTTTAENKLSAMLGLDAFNKAGLSIKFNIVDWGTGSNWGSGATQCTDSLKIYVSNNGGTSYGSSFSLVNLNQVPYNDGIWNNVSVDLSQLATNNSIVLSATTVVKFVFNLKGSGDTTNPKSGNQMIYMDNFTVTNNGALPVELVSFEVSTMGTSNLVTWITASEINNDAFYLEKSYDGKNWFTINTTKGNNGNSFQSYEFVDKLEFCYYRLKQVDFDGTTTYSSVIVSNYRTSIVGTEVYRVNEIGEFVDISYKGLVLIVYNNGTVLKHIQY